MRDSVSFCKQILKRRIRKLGKGKGTLGNRYLFEYVLRNRKDWVDEIFIPFFALVVFGLANGLCAFVANSKNPQLGWKLY